VRSLVLRPSAKINLTLRVGPRRDDGFHEVQTLLQSLALHDTLRVTGRPGPFALAVRSPGVPDDRTNLVWRAADRLWSALGRPGPARDAHVKLEKAIPAAAGLGGGSADAAAALVGLDKVWTGRLPRRRLVAIAADLGADVPFFLLGGTAFGVGRGEEVYPVDDLRQTGVVIIKPSFGVATADAYRWIDEDRAQQAAAATPARRPRDFEGGWSIGPIEVRNDLEPAVARRHAAIEEIIESLLREGAQAAAMTGSGAAVFGLFPETLARKAARRLQRPDWLVLVTRTIDRREASRRLAW